MTEAQQISDEELFNSLKDCAFGDPIKDPFQACDVTEKSDSPTFNLKFSAQSLVRALRDSLNFPNSGLNFDSEGEPRHKQSHHDPHP
jgi:hypothetical protein